MTEKTQERVFAHLTDLHPDGGVAFAHSVALAERAGAHLVSLYASDTPNARAMPNAAALLKRWEREPAAVRHTAMTHSCCDDPVDTLLDGLRPLNADLIVLGTHQWKGFGRLVKSSVSESIATQGLAPTLVLPIGEEGFVTEETGGLTLKRVLIPVGDRQEAEVAVQGAMRFLQQARAEDVEITLLRMGDGDFPLDVLRPEGVQWNEVRRPGGLVEGILAECEEKNCDLVVMASRGQDGILDVFRGTQTQQVMRKLKKALLVLPVK